MIAITGYQVFNVKGRNVTAGMIFHHRSDALKHAQVVSDTGLVIVKPVGEITAQYRNGELLKTD